MDLKYQTGNWSAYRLGSYSSSKIKYGAGDVDAALSENYHIQLFSNGEFLVGQVEVKNQLRRPSIQSNAGLGLQNMRERAENLGGLLQLDSVPGQGTRVTVILEDSP